MKLSDFRKDVNSRKSNYTNWKKDGKFVFWVHPESEIGKRTRIGIRMPAKGDDGEDYIRTIFRMYQDEKDPTAQLLSFIRDDDSIDLDEVILRIQSGDTIEEYNKGELLGLEEYGWKKQMLRPKTQYLLSVVNNADPKETEILSLPFSAGKKFVKIVDSNIEEYGEEEGNPWDNPYPLKVTFDGDASGTDMYNVERHLAKLTDEVQKVFDDCEPDDTERLCNPDNDGADGFGSTAELLAKILVIPVPFLEVDIEREEPATDTKERKPAETKEKKDDGGGAEKTPEGMVRAKDCKKGKTYVNSDGEKLKFKKVLDNGKVKFLDEDGDAVKVPGNSLLSDGAAKKEAPKDDGKVKVSDIKGKGTEYWNSDGEKLTFVRYNEGKEKGFFDDEDKDRVAMAGTEILFTKAPEGDAADPLAPIEEDEKMLCPNCEKEVPVSANECPFCEAKFQVNPDKPFGN